MMVLSRKISAGFPPQEVENTYFRFFKFIIEELTLPKMLGDKAICISKLGVVISLDAPKREIMVVLISLFLMLKSPYF